MKLFKLNHIRKKNIMKILTSVQERKQCTKRYVYIDVFKKN